MRRWQSDDFAIAGLSEPSLVLAWLRQGLTDWNNPTEIHNAFSPVCDFFDPREDAELQLAEMFQAISERERQLILQAVSLGLREAETTAPGYQLFDRLQRLTWLFERIEPVEAMIERMTGTEFPERIPPDVAQHLFAGCFYALSKLPESRATLSWVTRLCTSSRFDKSYLPYIIRAIGRLSVGRLLPYLGILTPDAEDIIANQAISNAIAEAAKNASPIQLVNDLILDEEKQEIEPEILSAVIVTGALDAQINELNSSMMRVAENRASLPDKLLDDTIRGLNRQRWRSVFGALREVRMKTCTFEASFRGDSAVQAVQEAVEARLVSA